MDLHACSSCGQPTGPEHQLCFECWSRQQLLSPVPRRSPARPETVAKYALLKPLRVRLLTQSPVDEEYRIVLRPGDPVVPIEPPPAVEIVILHHIPTGVLFWTHLAEWRQAMGRGT